MQEFEKKHKCHDEWAKIVETMKVHLAGAVPSNLFKQRRPMESKTNSSLTYREENYRNVTKSMFDLAIDQTTEVANTIDYNLKAGDKTLEAITKYKLHDGYKSVGLKSWVIDFIGRYKQYDPNGVVSVMPVHPTEKFMANYDYNIPNFNNVINTNIGFEVYLVPSADIIDITDDEILYKAGSWIVNDKGQKYPYYVHQDKNIITIIYPTEVHSEGKKSIEWLQHPYYNYNGETYPSFVIGGKPVTLTDENGEVYQYFQPDFFGAAQVADLLIGIQSDLQVIESRFTYPEKWLKKKACNNTCMPAANGVHYIGEDVCSTCRGSGFIFDTTPFGVHHLDDQEDFTESGQVKPPVGFITPDTSILKHDADRLDYYYKWLMRELGLNVQNLTDQSGESKRYDMMQRISMISNIVIDIYRLYENIVVAISTYLNDATEVKGTLPDDFDVKNSADIQSELIEAKKSDLPYPVLVELTKKYILSKFGNNEINKKKVEYLALNDKLFVYGIEDLRNAVATFGSEITAQDKMAHIMGWQVLDSIEALADLTISEIRPKFNELILEMTPVTVEAENINDFANALL